MADAKTWIEVVDTAVKVGLGVLISGGAQFLISRHSNSKAMAKEKRDQSKRMIIETAELVDEGATQGMKAIQCYQNKRSSEALDCELLSNNLLGKASTKAQLLGFNNIAAKITSQNTQSIDVLKNLRENDGVASLECKNKVEKLSTTCDEVQKSLADKFSRYID